MRISTEIASASRLVGEERAVELIAKAGFEAWDFSMFAMWRYDWGKNDIILPWEHPLAGRDYLAFARRLRQIGEDNGIVCNQAHAPFPTCNRSFISYFKRAIECTAEAGGALCVIHPDNNASPEENAELYSLLLPFAKECGVKIATENMWSWDDDRHEADFAACSTPESFKAHLDAVNDEYLVALVDVGHAEMRGLGTSAAEMICHLGGRVKGVHIHDTDLSHDNHELPFTMNIDYAPILKALKNAGYEGDLTLEADSYLGSAGYTADNVFDGIKNMVNTAKRLRDMYESL